MPAALDVDREAVRVLAVAVGVREAARRMDLPEDTVKSWALRGGWLIGPPSRIVPTVRQAAPTAPTAYQAMAAAMRDDAIQGRASGLRTSRRALAAIERMDDDELVTPEVTDVFAKHAKTASVLGGYNAGETVARISLSLAGQQSAAQPTGTDPAWIDGDFTAEPAQEQQVAPE